MVMMAMELDGSIDGQSNIEENNDNTDDGIKYASNESDKIMDSSSSLGFSKPDKPHLSANPVNTTEMKNSVGTGKGSMRHNDHIPGTGNVRKGKCMAALTSISCDTGMTCITSMR